MVLGGEVALRRKGIPPGSTAPQVPLRRVRFRVWMSCSSSRLQVGSAGAESSTTQSRVFPAHTCPPTLSGTQEISAANVSRHSAGATRRQKPTTTASWRLALPWVSLGAGWRVGQGPSEGPTSRTRQPLRAPRQHPQERGGTEGGGESASADPIFFDRAAFIHS
jgi:hypothetical protein